MKEKPGWYNSNRSQDQNDISFKGNTSQSMNKVQPFKVRKQGFLRVLYHAPKKNIRTFFLRHNFLSPRSYTISAVVFSPSFILLSPPHLLLHLHMPHYPSAQLYANPSLPLYNTCHITVDYGPRIVVANLWHTSHSKLCVSLKTLKSLPSLT